MKATLFSLVLGLITATVFAQNPTLDWAVQMGGSIRDAGVSITTDAAGNVYTTGFFNGTVDFDPGAGTMNLTSVRFDDIFIQKLDANGDFLWVRQIGGSGGVGGNSITTDAAGNVYTTGSFRDTVDFDPGAGTMNLRSVGLWDIFVQKLDANGGFLWARQMGGASHEYGFSITTDVAGNVYTTGSFKGTVDFDSGAGTMNLTSLKYSDIFVQKLDANGAFLWVRHTGGSGNDEGYSITTDAAGSVYTTGYFQDTVDFDPGAGTMSFTSTGGSWDMFIQKLDANGDFLWARQIGGSDGVGGNSITTDAAGNIYTTGSFRGTADFDPGAGTINLTSAGIADIFIQKLDANGDFLWAIQMGGTDFDRGASITTDAAGNVYTTGYFQDTADFDPGGGTMSLTSAGARDIFIQKLSQSGGVAIDKSQVSQLKLYPNPNSGLFSIELPVATHTAQLQIADALGRAVHQSILSQSKNQLDLSQLAVGIYYLEMRTASGEKFRGKLLLDE